MIRVSVTASDYDISFFRHNCFNKNRFNFMRLENLRSFRILYKCFLLMYKRAPHALDSVGVCSIAQFARAMFLGEKLVFYIGDSVIPIKSKSMSISVRSAWSWPKFFERKQTL